MEKLDCVVIGAGVVGLAIARQFAIQGREVLILEAEDTFGSGISSRNSEVIHAGVYYPRGSLKAALCIAGRKLLYQYCQERRIAHSMCGKLIVATTSSQLEALREIETKARDNGVADIRKLSREDAIAMEPSLNCVGALYSPSTGIIDSHGLMISLLGDAEDARAILVCRSPIVGGQVVDGGILLDIGGSDPSEVWARTVVNCAGLEAQAVAKTIKGVAHTAIPPLSYAKGSYFFLAGKSPFSHLIYPIPDVAGLGVHLTLDLGGQARFGPDVEWIESIDYEVDPKRADSFYGEVRRYWPDLPDNALQPAYAGIRPKPHLPNEPSGDFVISGPDQHGAQGLINLFGIESPGLTSAMALAEMVVNGKIPIDL